MRTNDYKITRLRITNYRGIEALDQQIGSGGAIVKGANGIGKSTVLHALEAALLAQDVGPDAIRIGADRAEILVDLGDLCVRRLITPVDNYLTISTPEGGDFKSPQRMLKELLGGGVDPLAFYAAKAEDRKRIVLQAMPTRVTAEQVARWIGADEAATMAPLIEDKPGLEVIAKLRSSYYDARAAANKLAKESAGAADRAAAGLAPITDAPPVEDAERAQRDADRVLERLKVQQATAEGTRKQGQATRDRADALRKEAEALLAGRPPAPSEADVRSAIDIEDELQVKVACLKKDLADAEAELKEASAKLDAMNVISKKREAAEREAAQRSARADELESAIAPANDVAPEVLADAAATLERAQATADLARAAVKARAEHQSAADLRARADTAKAEADRLDAIVETLTKDAPAELAQSKDMIPGLGFAPDGGVTLDGVAIDRLSGAEQLGIAVEIAKRSAKKARIIVCDGLERLDPGTYEHFLGKATEGGWQLWGTRVTDGELTIEAVEARGAAEGRAA